MPKNVSNNKLIVLAYGLTDNSNLFMQVPNEKLMQSDILNVTHSRNLTDRLTFEVDVLTMTPELCDDLAKRVVEMQEREEPRRLFNNDITPGSYILGVSNPLKYSVCCHFPDCFGL